MATHSRKSCALRDFLAFKWPDDANNFQNHPRPPIAKQQRFQQLSTADIQELSAIEQPKNTEYSTKWALKNFNEWKTERNSSFPDNPVPKSLLEEADAEQLNKWLSYYVAETRNTNGECYPPATLYQLLCGLLRHMRLANPATPNFLDKKDSRFRGLQTVVDNTFKKLRAEGIGCNSKHAKTLSKEEENKLWDSGVLGTPTPQALLRAVFYLNGKKLLPTWAARAQESPALTVAALPQL